MSESCLTGVGERSLRQRLQGLAAIARADKKRLATT